MIEDDLERLRTDVQQLKQHLATELQNLRDELAQHRADLPEGKPGQAGRDIDTAAVIARIKAEPELRELLRGPRGFPGTDGEPGPKGDDAATVIREVRISG